VNLKLKIWLALGLIIVLLQGLFSLLDYHEISVRSYADMRTQALNLRAVLMATRRVYHQQFLSSGLPIDDRTMGFLPAHALSRISSEFGNWTHSRARFNNVSDLPRNPSNRADIYELEAMAWHRAHPKMAERIAEIREADGRKYFHFTAPIWTEAYCLNCHSSPETAPAGIRARYASAYGYRVGDLRGVMSIKLPIEEVRAGALAHWWTEFWEQIALLLTILVVIGLLLNRLVIRRVDTLVAAVRGMSDGDYSRRIAPTGHDELDILGRGFDRMAAAVSARDDALEQSQAQAGALAELAPVGLFRADAQGNCTYVNEVWLRMAGLTETEAMGSGWAKALHANDRARVRAKWLECIDTAQAFSCEYRFQRPDGMVTWVLGQSRTEYGPGGEVIGYIGTITDITERKRVEELEHYGAFQAGIAEMATSVLHNIGNAITSVSHDADALSRASGELQRVASLLTTNARQTGESLRSAGADAGLLVAKQCAVQEEAAHIIDALYRDELCKRAQRIGVGVNHVADIVRIQQNAAAPSSQLSSFSLSQAIRSALALQGDTLEKHGIRTRLSVPEGLDQITQSHNRLLQVLINAIKNSIEAIRERRQTDPTHGEIAITVEAMDVGRIRLSIADNGAGFDPAVKERLFQFGFSTKQRGSGFGLHGMALFAQEAGGSVELDSAGPGQGACLVMVLPDMARSREVT
jgi:PAS domain S-box-containing protein